MDTLEVPCSSKTVLEMFTHIGAMCSPTVPTHAKINRDASIFVLYTQDFAEVACICAAPFEVLHAAALHSFKFLRRQQAV